MNRFAMRTLSVSLAATLAMGLAGCNRSADAGVASVGAPATVQPVGAVAAPASNDSGDGGVRYAKVVSVDPVRQAVGNPSRVCHDQTVTHTAPPADQHRIAGTAIGAVLGGLVGNQVGGGRGRQLATVAGAVGGGYAGNRIEADHQQGRVTSTVERRCNTVDSTSSRIVAYDVRYVYNGVTRTVRMDHDPGDRVQVQEGVTAVSDAR